VVDAGTGVLRTALTVGVPHAIADSGRGPPLWPSGLPVPPRLPGGYSVRLPRDIPPPSREGAGGPLGGEGAAPRRRGAAFFTRES